MNKIDLLTLINNSRGRFFSVVYRRKDGTRRILNGKEKYFRLLKGGQNNLINTPFVSVVDRNLEDWRAINSETLESFKCGKIQHNFVG